MALAALADFLRRMRLDFFLTPTIQRTRVLGCNTSSITFSGDVPKVSNSDTEDALQQASRTLHNKQPVAFPTETVYGLGALALDPSAASRIFSTKGRPPDNPLIVHVSSHTMLRRLLPTTYTIPPIYEILMKHFWPGALTLLFPTDPSLVPSIITANQPTVAVRMPSHPVARALISIADAPIAAPSANSSGKPSPTRAEHVLRDLDGKIQLILDGGACGVGLESTVVDGLNEDGNLRVLRPGGVTVEDLERVLRVELGENGPIPRVLVHKRDYKDEAMEQTPTTPGMKYKHYSPTVPVILACTVSPPPHGTEPTTVQSFLDDVKHRQTSNGGSLKIGILATSDSGLAAQLSAVEGIEWTHYSLGPVADPSIAAQRLFDGLLTLDQAGVDLIVAEEVREEREGLAFMNRLRKAAGDSVWLRM
ncbi:hypothetical protein QCA50_000369 [Cerrena zonata]|uniref:Threonylcarbamoyl-AMP synthase n=1 Tax=Cerrena zonata TaxID=2478898 RepID=A0AAW0GXT8_9APHY